MVRNNTYGIIAELYTNNMAKKNLVSPKTEVIMSY